MVTAALSSDALRRGLSEEGPAGTSRCPLLHHTMHAALKVTNMSKAASILAFQQFGLAKERVCPQVREHSVIRE